MGKKWIHVVLLTILLLSACSSPELDTTQPEEVNSTSDTAGGESSSSAEESSPSPTVVPPADVLAEAEATQEIVHWEIPGNFKAAPLQKIFDCKTAAYFTAGKTYELSEVCDKWEENYFERPLNEELTELYPQLDIVEAESGQDDNWYYTQILVYAELIDNLVLDGVYALEIDLDLDARGGYPDHSQSTGGLPGR